MAAAKKIVRIADTDLMGDVPLLTALSRVKGISHSYAHAIVNALGEDPEKQVGTMSKEEITELTKALRNPTKHGVPSYLLNRQKDRDTGKDRHLISSDIELTQSFDIKRLKKIKAYRGIRHARGLKVRGQRTKSTGRKGGTMGVSRKKKGAAVAKKLAAEKKKKGGK